MCGVFGWVSHSAPLTPRDVESARKTINRLAHRGPDYCGEWKNDVVFMGHRRLSIIDLTDAANQPFIDPSGRYALGFNGEIYNYVELREDLRREGYEFRTRSDTEVLLAALIRWGDDAFGRLDGMFAGALHDRQTGRHLLFRDPLGQKPLYYVEYPGGVIYASELRAITGLAQFEWRTDGDAFRRFLMHGYYSETDTPVVGVRKLLPGCTLEIAGGRTSVMRYWDSIPGQDPLDISEDEAVGVFERLFSQSCARSMRSDVPYGVFMSGGIDSSLILDFCHEINPDIGSFTVAMGESDFDESTKAAMMAKHVGVSDHHTFSMNTESVISAMTDVLASNDEPHGDPGFVNAYFLAKSAKPHLTVALAGDGGDELFAGYLPFTGLATVPYLKVLPETVLEIVKAVARAVPENDGYLGLRFKAQSYLRGFPADDLDRYPLWLASMDPEAMGQLCRTDFFERSNASLPALAPITRLLGPVGEHSRIQQFLYYYQKVFLPEFVCMHTDRAAMQFSLEVRSPFLAPDLVAFANRLPDRMKLRGSTTKWLLKQVARKRGFPDVVAAQKKQGFTFPLARWLKSSLKPMMADLLNPDEWAADGLIDTGVMEGLMADHLEGRSNNYRILYNLMCFRAWRRAFPDIKAV